MKTTTGQLPAEAALIKKRSLSSRLNLFLDRRSIFAGQGGSIQAERPVPHHLNCMASLTEDGRCTQCGLEFEP